jgi:hypothetical protein
MADFFGGLSSGNVRLTDARINGGGPLPTSLSGPEGINGDPDGRYNFNDALLSGIAPYAGPKTGRMGSDRNYQQIPHRKQYPVPKVYLPEPAWDSSETFDMSHPIDMGDLVFIFNVNYKHFLLEGKLVALQHCVDNTMPNYNVFLNVCSANYVLAGVYAYVTKYVKAPPNEIANAQDSHAWYKMIFCLGLDDRLKKLRTWYANAHEHVKNREDRDRTWLEMCLTMQLKLILQDIVRDKLKPHGICSTSEKQGGQHETGYKPVQAAASFYVTLTVDGQNRDLVNIWRAVDIAGGDLLMLQLNFVECPDKYVLNHYYKGWIQRSKPPVSHCFQLVPGVARTAFLPEKTKSSAKQEAYYIQPMRSLFTLLDSSTQILPSAKAMDLMLNAIFDNRQCGYWHIGQCYSMKQRFDNVRHKVPSDDMAMTRGPIMQINFAPVWHGSKNDITGILLGKYRKMQEYLDQPEDDYTPDVLERLTEAYCFLAEHSLTNRLGMFLFLMCIQHTAAGVPATKFLRWIFEWLEQQEGDAQYFQTTGRTNRARAEQGARAGDEHQRTSQMLYESRPGDDDLLMRQPLQPRNLQVAASFDTPVPRFKKARVVTTGSAAATQIREPEVEAAVMKENTQLLVADAQAGVAQAESSGDSLARVEADWEADLAAIFSEETNAGNGTAPKARGKGKPKSA